MALLSSSSSEAQRMAAYTLRQIQPSMGVASPAIVDPVLKLLQSLHLEVQYEGTYIYTVYQEFFCRVKFSLSGLKAYFRSLSFIVVAYCPRLLFECTHFRGLIVLRLSVTKIKPNENFSLYVLFALPSSSGQLLLIASTRASLQIVWSTTWQPLFAIHRNLIVAYVIVAYVKGVAHIKWFGHESSVLIVLLCLSWTVCM